MGEIKKDAKITAGIEGADAIAKAADKALKPWETAAKSAGKAVQSAFQGVISDITRTVTVANAISFGQAIASARQYREELGRLSVTGGPVSQLRSQIDWISKSRLIREQDITAAAAGFGKMVYSTKDAMKAIGGLADVAIATGRSLDEYLPTGATLINQLGVASEDTEKQLGRIWAQAQKLGTTGGPAALYQQINQLGDSLSRVSHGTDEARGKITAFMAGIGKGYSPDVAKRISGGLLGDVTSRWRDYERVAGMKMGSAVDERGEVIDPIGLMEKARTATMKWAGGNRGRAMFALSHRFDSQTAAALLNADFGAMRREALIAPSGEPAALRKAWEQGEGGQAVARQLQMERAAREAAGRMLPIADAAQGLLAAHPFAGAVGMGAAGGMIGAGGGHILSEMSKALGNELGTGARAIGQGGRSAETAMTAGGIKAAAALQAGATGFLGKLGLLGIAGAAGYEAGKWVDEKTGLSDKLSGVSIKGRSDAQMSDIERAKRDPAFADRYVKMFGGSPAGRDQQVYDAALGNQRARGSQAYSDPNAQHYDQAGGMSLAPGFSPEIQVSVQVVNAGDNPVTATAQAKSGGAKN